jgi:small subunit ribosomal protein S24e
MEIEIESKRNNPLLNRTEIYFTVKHEGEGTPNREIIKSELAEKLNVKKESIIVSSLNSGFGIQQISGYAKVYTSDKKTRDYEPDYILIRNKLMEGEKKAEKKEAPAAKAEVKPAEPASGEKPAEPAAEEKPAQPAEEAPTPDQPTQETPEKAEEKEEITPPEEPPSEEKPPTEEKPPVEEKPPAEEKPPVEEKKESKDVIPEDKPPEKPAEEKADETQTEKKEKVEEKKDETSEEKKE